MNSAEQIRLRESILRELLRAECSGNTAGLSSAELARVLSFPVGTGLYMETILLNLDEDELVIGQFIKQRGRAYRLTDKGRVEAQLVSIVRSLKPPVGAFSQRG